MPVFDPELRRALYASAIEANLHPPEGQYRHAYVNPAPIYRRWGVQWVWDIPYSGWIVATVGGRPDLAKGFIRNQLAFQDSEGPDAGMVPLAPMPDGRRYADTISQTPMLCWLAAELHRLEPDDAFVEDVYPALSRWIRWFRSERRDADGDGLSEYAGANPTFVAYEGLDFGPYQDLVMDEPGEPGADGLVHDPLASVMLNACLYRECLALSELARTAAKADADRWRAEAEHIATEMRAAMWDPDIGGFFNVVRGDLVASRPRHYRITPDLLMPLWAGFASSEEARRTIDLIRGVPENYPFHDGTMEIRLGARDRYHHGYQIVTHGLHPASGPGPAAGGVRAGAGVEMTVDGWRGEGTLLECEWPSDRLVSRTSFRLLTFSGEGNGEGGSVEIAVSDGSGARRTMLREDVSGTWSDTRLLEDVPPVPSETHGLRRIEVRVTGDVAVSRVRVRYSRPHPLALLCPYGVRSAHPLDGKHPAPGAPSRFWSGTVWGPQVWHTCHALGSYGYTALAREVARAYCEATTRAYASGGASFEHLSPFDGTGMGTIDYTWGAGLALALEREFLTDGSS